MLGKGQMLELIFPGNLFAWLLDRPREFIVVWETQYLLHKRYGKKMWRFPISLSILAFYVSRNDSEDH